MTKTTQVIQSIAKSPFLWGLLGAAGFYALIFGGPLDYQVVRLYFTHHPVEYLETAMFAVGLAVLVLKVFDIGVQRVGLKDSPLSSVGPSLQPIEACDTLLARLERLSDRRQGEYYICRLRAALEHVRHRGAADQLDDELKYLADMDVAKLHQSYGLFRVIVWAIPILGFLGTVIGITMMLTGAAQIANGADQSSMFKIFEGLGLKFNTTALALTLSMVLMFIHFFVDRAESSLLEQVDLRVQQELAGRFPATASILSDPSSAAVSRMAEAIRQTTDMLLRRQAELWQASVEAAARQWSEMIGDAGEQVRAAMSAATGELSRRAEVLEQAVCAAGEVARLEDSLNHNLSALAGSQHFEQTVLSLAAAVNMLSARLVESPPSASSVQLESSSRRSAHAA